MQYHNKKNLQRQPSSMYNWQRKYDDKMYELVAIYYKDLKNAIENKSNKGKRELYYNFSWDNFKFNLPNTGKPSKMCRVWMNQMCTHESMYLCEDVQNGIIIYLDHFKGLRFDIFNNASLTVHFTW
jgi:hypothetical protein